MVLVTSEIFIPPMRGTMFLVMSSLYGCQVPNEIPRLALRGLRDGSHSSIKYSRTVIGDCSTNHHCPHDSAQLQSPVDVPARFGQLLLDGAERADENATPGSRSSTR